MSNEKEMSFWGHIGELRVHLIRSLIAIVICAIFIGYNIEWIMDNIFFGPTQNSFPTFKIVNHFSRELIGEDSINLPKDFPVRVQKLYQQFNVMMAVSFFGGMVMALPYIVWQMWLFISPALKPEEKKSSAFLVNFVWILFILGALCGYFLILPFAINFGVIFKISKIIVPLYDLSDYTTLFMQVVLGMGVVFLFPVIVHFLTVTGILTPQFLRTYRRHAIILILIIAAIVTPADMLSMIIAALPLLALYEFSILMSSRIHKRNLKKEAAILKSKTSNTNSSSEN